MKRSILSVSALGLLIILAAVAVRTGFDHEDADRPDHAPGPAAPAATRPMGADQTRAPTMEPQDRQTSRTPARRQAADTDDRPWTDVGPLAASSYPPLRLPRLPAASDASAQAPDGGVREVHDEVIAGLHQQRDDGREQRRVWLVRRADFKYPLIRVVEVDGRRHEMVADHLMVRPAPGRSAEDLRSAGLGVRKVLPLTGTVLVEIPAEDPADLDAAATRLAALPQIAGVDNDYVVQPLIEPDDPRYTDGSLWGLHNTGQDDGTEDADIDAPEAWDITTGSEEVLIGVIDTGIQIDHPDLEANIWTNPGEIAGNGIDDDGNGYIDDVHGWDFIDEDNDPQDDHSHGTHVAGTIGASGDDGVDLVGVAWTVRMMALKFMGPKGGLTSDAVEAVAYATEMGAMATNNSWGGGGYNQTLYDTIGDAGEAGSLFVAAAGNSGGDSDAKGLYPAAYDHDCIISVAASDRDDELASFSNYGATTVDLAAPGAAILSSTPTDDYATWNGTSMATPHVTGTAALLKSLDTQMPMDICKRLLLDNVDVIADFDGLMTTGGRLNAHAALQAVIQDPFLGIAWVAIDDDDEDDSAGNGNGFIEPGETIGIAVDIANFGDDALTGLEVTTSVTDDYVTVTRAEHLHGELAAHGRVTIDEAGLLAIDADCPNHHEFTLTVTVACAAGSLVIDKTLEVYHPRVFSGVVRLDGDPYPEATVYYDGADGALSGEVVVDSEGAFALSLPDVVLAVYADHDDANALTASQDFAEGDSTEDLTFDFITATISGTVTDKATGDVLDDVSVSAYDWTTEGSKADYLSDVSDADGAYSLEMIVGEEWVGSWRVGAAHNDRRLNYLQYFSDSTIAAPPDATHDISLDRIGIAFEEDFLTIPVVAGETREVEIDLSNVGSVATTFLAAPELTPYRLEASYAGDPLPTTWTSIADSGTARHAAFRGDDGVHTLEVALPFTVPFFGRDQDTIYINENGYITFDPMSEDEVAANTFDMPNFFRPTSCVSFVNSWLTLADKGSLYTEQIDDDTFVIEFNRVPSTTDDSDLTTAQLHLKRNGDCLMQWQRLDDVIWLSVGLQDQSCMQGATLFYNTDDTSRTYLRDATGRIVYLPGENDHSQTWARVDPQDGSLAVGATTTLTVTVDATHLEAGSYDTRLRARAIEDFSSPVYEYIAIPLRMQVIEALGAPVAHAGDDGRAVVGQTGQLDAERSVPAAEGDTLSYQWRQVDGPIAVALQDAGQRAATFTTPRHLRAIGDYTFEVAVSDGTTTSTDTVVVTVVGENVALGSAVQSNQTRFLGDNTPANIVDGHKRPAPKTHPECTWLYCMERYRPEGADDIILDIDLGRPCTLHEYGMLLYGGHWARLRLEYRDDDGWTTLVHKVLPDTDALPREVPDHLPVQEWVRFDFEQVEAQFLRIRWEDPDDNRTWWLVETELRGLPLEVAEGRCLQIDLTGGEDLPAVLLQVQPDDLPMGQTPDGDHELDGLHPQVDHTVEIETVDGEG
ncbi:MAG: S8 family serine peptidase [Planctomycetota bacterium]